MTYCYHTVEFPCEVGDTVWCITSDQIDYITEPIECKVVCILNCGNGWEFEINSKHKTGGWGLNITIPAHMNKRTANDFGKTVFFNETEAKIALKQMNYTK